MTAKQPTPQGISTLAAIRERGYRNGATGAECARLSDSAAVDVPVLLAAIDAALKVADEWDALAKKLESRSEFLFERSGETAAVMLDGRSQAHKDCARALREAISRELTGQETGDDR